MNFIFVHSKPRLHVSRGFCVIMALFANLSLWGQQRFKVPLIEPELNKPVTLLAVGDLMLGARAISVISKNGISYPFDSTGIKTHSADVAIANLEAPFSLSGKAYKGKKYTFRVPPNFGDSFAASGIDVVSMANNHMMDYGDTALFDTIHLLDSLGIRHCGAGNNLETAEKPDFMEVNGKTFAFLGYSLTYPSEYWARASRAGTVYPVLSRIKSTIAALDTLVDYVVVSFHWGGEYLSKPKAYQVSFAHGVIDSGADLVIGHHPHILQGLEWYKDRLIAYSLGNYVFGSYSLKVQYGAMLKVMFIDNRLFYAELIPIDVNNNRINFQPKILKGKRRNQVIAHVNDLSKDLNEGDLMMSESGIIQGPLLKFDANHQ